jgi:hypothetical protein
MVELLAIWADGAVRGYKGSHGEVSHVIRPTIVADKGGGNLALRPWAGRGLNERSAERRRAFADAEESERKKMGQAE